MFSQLVKLLLGLPVFAIISSATTDKPALILVPGTFHRASVYDEVKNQLDDLGYRHIDAVDLPSNGYDIVGVKRKSDVNAVVQLLEARLQVGDDVVLVGNSYGATVIMEAVKDFEDRSVISLGDKKKGEGQIFGLIMLSGYIPTIAEVNHAPPRPDIRTIGAPFFNYQGSSNSTPEIVTWDLDLVTYPPSQTFYNLLDTPFAKYWTSQLLPASFEALNATGTYIPYDGKFRTLYVIGEHDNSVSPQSAQAYIGQEGAQFEVEIIDGDHVPMLSRPEVVVDVIRRFARDGVTSLGEEVVSEGSTEL